MAALLLFALGSVQAHAVSGGAKCVSISGDITNLGGDGSSCEAQADSGGKAIATAKGDSDAMALAGNKGRANTSAKDTSKSDAEAPNGGRASSTAIHSGQALAVADGSGGKATASANNAEAYAKVLAESGQAKAKAKNTVNGSGGGAIAASFQVCNTTASAVGSGAIGESECGIVNGGTAKATSKNSDVQALDIGGGKAIAKGVNTGVGAEAPVITADTYGVCNANTNANGVGSASDASCGEHADHGKAGAKSTKGGLAIADAQDACSAKANATTGGKAQAVCTTSGGYVKVTASGGGVAKGSDTATPVCNPNGGMAKVRSSAGNCG